MTSKLERIDTEQRLYIIRFDAGRGQGGYSTLGFDYADKLMRGICAWCGREDIPRGTTPGTGAHYQAYRNALLAGRDYHLKTGQRCDAELTPELVGLEHWRVEVVTCWGEKRRFYVGKSTGWCPCHLEILSRRSTGGGAVTGAPFKSVRKLYRR